MLQVNPLLDAAGLLHNLQQVNEIAQSLSGQPDPAAIARRVTDALVERFGCAFARIWLVEPDQTALRLVASSGLYTHLNGSFARVPMGAYKVGKIAQNRVPFLSNHLAAESWVKDRQWALDNQLQGFAGYPLVAGDRVVGVLVSFSHAPFAPEFLEVLQVLCMTLTVALAAALQSPARGPLPLSLASPAGPPLSDQMAQILGKTQLTLVGTERPLRLVFRYLLLQVAELLNGLACSYCRLTYTPASVALEALAIAPPSPPAPGDPLAAVQPDFADLQQIVTGFGGTLQIQPVMQGQAGQLSLAVPTAPSEVTVQIHCRHPLVQQGLTQLAYQAGLSVGGATPAAVLITDQPSQLGALPTLWVRHDRRHPVPQPVNAVMDLSTTPAELRHLVDRARQSPPANPSDALLSNREQQVMQLLAAGKRDRDIAQELFISESTVKFHINNSLTKLHAKNRYQGVHQATLWGWI